MKIVCSYSSLVFTCEHFPGTLDHKESHHPVFSLPQKKLLAYLPRWSNNSLTPTDKYLLFVSVLKSSDLVEFRVPAIQTKDTQSIIALWMEKLCKTVSKLNAVTNPAAIFPHFVITPETKTLENVPYWLDIWEESFKDFQSGKSRDIDDRNSWQKLQQREAALERLIKNPHKPISAYASQLADWAATAGKFPDSQTVSRFSHLKCSLSDYWRQIIIKCAQQEQLFAINREDLEELIEHCETEIPIGSIYSNALFKLLRHAHKKQQNFLGLGDLDIGSSTYQILRPGDSVEDANLQAMVQAAPTEEPRADQYPSKLAYLRAKMNFDLAKKFTKPAQSQE